MRFRLLGILVSVEDLEEVVFGCTANNAEDKQHKNLIWLATVHSADFCPKILSAQHFLLGNKRWNDRQAQPKTMPDPSLNKREDSRAKAEMNPR
ncbi:hypothetical protein CEXT_373651 [Caerostris extrusa]|uniref:Uncharacterized protein n=1 Tax=Caerostris extrusa TaxID=172846 RepID=A0AAV4QR79_CAEEX|nr:hypothetical protein CEXT_373651 [Caerostris extrusa]